MFGSKFKKMGKRAADTINVLGTTSVTQILDRFPEKQELLVQETPEGGSFLDTKKWDSHFAIAFYPLIVLVAKRDLTLSPKQFKIFTKSAFAKLTKTHEVFPVGAANLAEFRNNFAGVFGDSTNAEPDEKLKILALGSAYWFVCNFTGTEPIDADEGLANLMNAYFFQAAQSFY